MSMPPQPTVQPLSLTRRRLYFGLLVCIFVIALPLVYLYATGYRFGDEQAFVPTGGLYVGAGHSGAEIYLDGELVRETGTFRRAFYIQNLEPGEYDIRVEKDDYHSWEKTLEIFPRIVTEAQAFNVPLEPVLRPIPERLPAGGAVSQVENPEFAALVDTFATTTTATTFRAPELLISGGDATTTVRMLTDISTSTKEFRDMMLYEGGNGIAARWVGSIESVPFYLCVPDSDCAREVPVNTRGESPVHFDFFPGTVDLVVVALSDGVFVTELDNRSGQNLQPLILGEDVDARVVDGNIYIREAEDFFEVEL